MLTKQLGEEIENLSPAKRELLARQLREKLGHVAAPRAIQRRGDAETLLPASLAQQRLWFFEELTPGSAAYNVPAAVRLKGYLDADAFGQAVNEIVRRHEALRTTFKTVEKQPFQVIAPELKLRLSVTDIRGLPEGAREAETLRLMTEEAQRPFDLQRGPLLRVGLIRNADDEHVLTITMHHIISDGWSVIIFVRELAVLYSAYCTGQPSPLPEPPIQYADYAAWQRRYLSGPTLERQLEYWRRRLADAPPLLDLRPAAPRPAEQCFRGAHRLFTLGNDLLRRLKELGRREDATLFMTLLAGFCVVLRYYSGRADIVVGTDVANRGRAEVEGLIGFFVNQLVLRVDVRAEATFEGVLRGAREVCLEAYAHQEVPFDRVVEAVNPPRSLGHTPVFQVKLVLQNSPAEELDLPGLALTMLEVESGTAQFDLILNMMATREGLVGTVEYSTDLFDEGWLNRLLGHYEAVLEAVAEDPRRSVSELEAERAEADRRHQQVRQRELEETSLNRLKKARRKAISVQA